MSNIITKTLYRSLLRTAKPFASSFNGPILCALIYRIGLDDDHFDYIRFQQQQQQQRQQNQEQEKEYTSLGHELGDNENEKKSNNVTTLSESLKDVHLSKEEARDLTKTYNELRKIHFDKEKLMKYNEDDEEWSITVDEFKEENSSSPHVVLYKQLLRQLLFSEQENIVRQMVFPSQIISSDGQNCTIGQKLINMIRNEFRLSSQVSSDAHLEKTKVDYTKSSSNYYTDATRRDAGFLVLRELQKKLEWAELLGLDNLFNNIKTKDSKLLEVQQKRQLDERIHNEGQAAKDVHVIPVNPSTNYLQSGAFLVAHPMLGGIFARSVICILQHSDVERKSHIAEVDKIEENSFSNRNGGTYGLMINYPLRVGVPSIDSTRRRDRTLREVIRHDSLPEGVRLAFGECTVRNGGPVNFSLQMLRSASPEQEEKVQIGGNVLPKIISDRNSDISTALYSDKAIYFGGDIIKAAQAVMDGVMERGKRLLEQTYLFNSPFPLLLT